MGQIIKERREFYKNSQFLGQVFSKIPTFCQILHAYPTFINNYARVLTCFSSDFLLLLPRVSSSRFLTAQSLTTHSSQLHHTHLLATSSFIKTSFLNSISPFFLDSLFFNLIQIEIKNNFFRFRF